jgi:ADP-ribose pyrophosphatase YjhB (NUDIX family)
MQNKAAELITIAQRIRALNETALVYSHNEYEIDRSKELIGISQRITALVSGLTEDEIAACYSPVKEYVTPKVDVRAVIFNSKDEILLVREKADGRWSIPGGWADVGLTPSEIAVKEAKEETGCDVKIERLLAVFDKRCWNHPASPFYIYKFCFLCSITGGNAPLTFDILEKGFFPLNNLPPLSIDRILPEQIVLLDDLRRSNQSKVFCD